MRVLLVDDHDLFRTGLRNLLEGQGIDIVGEAAGGSEALQTRAGDGANVVVMDLNMPGMNGVEATRHISRDAPLTRVIVLTISDQEAGRDGRDPRRARAATCSRTRRSRT